MKDNHIIEDTIAYIDRLGKKYKQLEEEKKQAQNQLQNLWANATAERIKLEAENVRLKDTLQKIKEIADARCDECKYGKDGITCKFGDCGEAKLHLITQLINESEV